MDSEGLIQQLRLAIHFFDTSTAWLTEEDATFAPVEGMFTTSQQVAHVAQTIDWFGEGAFGSSWDMDFAGHEAQVRAVCTVSEARDWLTRAVENASKALEAKSPDELTSPLPEGGIMAGSPRGAVVGGIVEHTSHHRGALAVYARMRGKTPPMPYA
jgi:uncharacterized damage-inducible protein DinB